MTVTDSAAVLEVVYMGDLQPKPFQPQLVGNGAVLLAGLFGISDEYGGAIDGG